MVWPLSKFRKKIARIEITGAIASQTRNRVLKARVRHGLRQTHRPRIPSPHVSAPRRSGYEFEPCPWGRPDMALFLFTQAILNGEPINVFNHGDMVRDFTYIDDIITGIVRVIDSPSTGNSEWSGISPNPAESKAPYRIFNIGNNNPIRLMDFILEIESQLGVKAKKEMKELQPGDVPATYADVEDLVEKLGYKPETSINEGISKFLEWYKNYYQVGE